MKPTVVQSYHSPELVEKIRQAWDRDSLLVIAPPSFAETEKFVDKIPSSTTAVYGLFSTGTLGAKLILYTKKNIEASLKSILSFFDLNRFDSVFCYPQPYHVFGLVLGNLLAERYGKKYFFSSGPYRSEVHETWLQTVQPKMLTLGTPTHFQDLIQYVKQKDISPTPSYSCIIGGAPVTRQLWTDVNRLLKIEAPSVGYGASELSPGATHLPPGRAPTEDFEVGVALPGVELSVDDDGLRATGENVCETIIAPTSVIHPTEIILRDHIALRSDGIYVYKGRLDLVLNRGGEKFSLEAIEQFLKAQLNLDAVAVAVKHPRLGQELALMVEGDFDRETAKAMIYPALAKTFGREFDSFLCFILDSLPTNPNSKVDRQRCRSFVEESRVPVKH